MKIFVSNDYLNWIESRRSDKKAINAFWRFFENVHTAKTVAEAPKPRKRDGGTTQGGSDGTVLSYEIARTYRLYANWVSVNGGSEMAFYAAIALSKSDEKSQSDNINKAARMFKSFDLSDWLVLEPSQEPSDAPTQPQLDAGDDAFNEIIQEPKAKKKKGKKVGEDGLTIAERKALRKKEEAEKRKQAAEQKRIAAAKKKAAENAANDAVVAPAVPVSVESENVSAVVPVVVATPASTADETKKPAPKKKRSERTLPTFVINTAQTGDAVDAPVAEPSVTVNDIPVATPQKITGDVQFQKYTDVQYELELIEHQMKIENLQLEIIRQNIAMAQREIALEELAIKRLQLLQTQKAQTMQK